jgi:hypothetical protein
MRHAGRAIKATLRSDSYETGRTDGYTDPASDGDVLSVSRGRLDDILRFGVRTEADQDYIEGFQDGKAARCRRTRKASLRRRFAQVS